MKITYKLILCLILLLLSSCGGSSESASSIVITKIELVDTTPLAFSGFGTKVVKLTGGQLVVHEFQNPNFPNAGTIRVYDSLTGNLINTIEGNQADDRLGSEGILALPNGNFLIVSSLDDVGGVVDAGSVILASSAGLVISTVSGDQFEDFIGSEGVTLLSNGNFVIRSRFDDVMSIVDSGSVKLVDVMTGTEIQTLSSDSANDNFANAGVFALPNGNFLISSSFDDISGIDNVGSVKLVNGSTGAVISTTQGDQLEDNLGIRGIAVLANGNFVISSWVDDNGGVVNAGSVKLVNGATGITIASIVGDDNQDSFGTEPAFVLSNGNFVITSPTDDVGGFIDTGSVKIVNGATGAILNSIVGDQDSDLLGLNGILDGLSAGSTNGSFAIFSEFDDNGLVSNAGSIKIIDKDTNNLIFNTQGTVANARLGSGKNFILSNKNFVLYSSVSNNGSILNAGHVTLYNGSNGSQIASYKGDQGNDYLGSDGVIALSNGNIVVSSSQDGFGAVLNAGSVKLIRGTTGALIKQFKGNNSDDRISIGGTKIFTNGDFGFVSDLEDVNSIDSAGTVRFVSGTTGKEYFSDSGQSSFDFQNGLIVEISADEFLFSTPGYDLNSTINSGRVLIYKK